MWIFLGINKMSFVLSICRPQAFLTSTSSLYLNFSKGNGDVLIKNVHRETSSAHYRLFDRYPRHGGPRSHQISYFYKAYNFVFGTSVYGSYLIYIVAGMNYIYKSALSRDPCNGTAIFNIIIMCAFVYRSERQIQTTSNKTAKKTLPNMATLSINSGLLTVIYYHRCALSDLLFSVMFDTDVFKFFFTARFRRERYV